MKIKNDHLYRKMATFEFNGKHFAMFKDCRSKMAFLEIDENNKFHYPELKDVLLLTELFTKELIGVRSLIYDNKDTKVTRYKFIPKVIVKGTIMLLTASMLAGCGQVTQNSEPSAYELEFQRLSTGESTNYSSHSSSNKNETTTIEVEEDKTSSTTQSDNSTKSEYELMFEQLMQEQQNNPSTPASEAPAIPSSYLQFLSPADDEYDWKYADDFQSTIPTYVYAKDSKAYEYIFGVEKPTQQEIFNTIDNNRDIDAESKEFIKEMVADWFEMYPDTDFTVFNYNLKTLKVIRASASEIQMTAMSSGTVACYIPKTNTICLNESIDFSKESNGYVTFVHELLHAARGTKTKIGNVNVQINYNPSYDEGLYEDEALCTWFAYQLQHHNCPNLNNKSIYYTLQSSIYRQILPYMDYDGADYMNHSMSYFMEKLQDYFDEQGIEIQAYHFVNLVDSQAQIHYEKYTTPDYTNFSEEYETLVINYCNHHLNSNMTYAETEQAFQEFWEDITFNFSALPDPYPEITKQCFKPYWDTYVKNMGISQSLSK